jgi:NAD(P)-dependent dehydrogenase (short-subunit alcohol dehydrogenase family)
MIEDEYGGLRALVTGAASGMGAAVTELLVRGGAEVHAVDVAPVTAPVAAVLRCDLRDESEVHSLAEAIDPPDAVFCCAGLPQTHPAAEVLAVNFLANRSLIDTVAPRMAVGGAIAVVSSVTYGWERTMKSLAPLVTSPTFSSGAKWYAAHQSTLGDPYVVSKMCLTAWCVAESVDLATRGIRLNVLGPGTTETPMLPSFQEAIGDQLHAMPCPVGRPSAPEEQARAMLFLNAPSSTYLVGSVLYNDGGMSASFAALTVAVATAP